MELRGLQTHFALLQPQLKSREDCLVIALHVALLNKDILCVGKGDDWPEGQVQPSELLPAEWNINQEVYSLCYTSKSQHKYIVKIVVIPDCLLVNVVEMNDGKVAATSLKTDQYINEEYKQFSDAFKNMPQLCEVVDNEIFKTPKKMSEPKERKESKKNYQYPEYETGIPDFNRGNSNRGIPNYGRGDLDPLAGGIGGGMLYQPPNMGRGRRPRMPGFDDDDDERFGLPFGAVPPGARFDEYNPARLF